MPEVRLSINGREIVVPAGTVVAAAIAIAEISAYRRSPQGDPRAPLCGMGVCFECRVEIDGLASCLSCQSVCQDGMRVVIE